MKVAIVGLGLIGGSFAKAFKRFTGHTVLGADMSRQVLDKAQLVGAIDSEFALDEMPECDLLLLCAWPHHVIEYMQKMAQKIRPGTLVVDACGVKQEVCEVIRPLSEKYGFTYYGGHPMAGKELSGFTHSSALLFGGASMILCPPRDATIFDFERIKRIFTDIGFGRVTITSPENHDRVIAYTSQLAHIASSAFIKSPTALEHAGFSAGSYKDLTRVARLDPDMWTELFHFNRPALLEEVDRLIENLQAYRDALADEDDDKMRALLLEGREQKITADKKEGKA